jgi:anti-sigma factor RsiW
MKPMSQLGSRDDHFHRLGLFVLGALPLDEHLAVEEHVAQCPRCQAECDELSEVPAFLSVLSEEDIRMLAEEFAPERDTPPVPKRHPVVDRSAGLVRPAPPSMPTRSSRPGDSPPGRHARPRRSVRDRVAASLPPGGRGRLVVAAIMVTLAVGIGIGTWLQTSGSGPFVPVTFAAAATDGATGASVSIVVTGKGNGAHVEATVGGLRAGVQYQLFAVTVRGETEVATRWIGADGQSTVTADLDRPPQEWAFFTVAQMDGVVVVSVRVTGVTSTP